MQFAAEREHATNLADLLFRRTGAGWTADMAGEAAGRAASAVAGVLGWDDARIAAEVAGYREYLARSYLKMGKAE